MEETEAKWDPAKRLTLSRRGIQVWESSLSIANRMDPKHNDKYYVDTGHLLLALLDVGPSCKACAILTSLGVDCELLRKDVLASIAEADKTQSKTAPSDCLIEIGDSPFQIVEAPIPIDESASLRWKIHVSAAWFYGLAIFSIVSGAIMLLTGQIIPVIGLGVDIAIHKWAGQGSPLIALANLLLAIIFAASGYFGQKEISSAFLLGSALYALDMAVFFTTPVPFGAAYVVVHLIVLSQVVFSLWHISRLREMQRQAQPAEVEEER